MALAGFKKICVDAVEPLALGEFWSTALDQRLEPDATGEAGLVDAEHRYTVWFNRVPQAKSVKHRVHLDIYARSLVDLEALGASVVLPQGDDRKWTVMADPPRAVSSVRSCAIGCRLDGFMGSASTARTRSRRRAGGTRSWAADWWTTRVSRPSPTSTTCPA